MSTSAQIAANQANSQKSTGPKTDAGLSTSSRNNFRHGLCGAFHILQDEDPDKFDQLLESLVEEHQPATPTEQVLVERIAQHQWLVQRALMFQDLCLETRYPGVTLGNETLFALYLRYQTANENAFRKCFADLLKLKNERRKEQIGSESQNRKLSIEFRRHTEEIRKRELHELRLQVLKAKLPAVQTPQKPVAATQTALKTATTEAKLTA